MSSTKGVPYTNYEGFTTPDPPEIIEACLNCRFPSCRGDNCIIISDIKKKLKGKKKCRTRSLK